MGANNGASEPGEVFNLDALEREPGDRFPFVAAGQTFYLENPDELDWRVQAELESGDIRRIYRVLLGDQFEAFEQIPLPAWKLEELMQAAGRYYGISVPESPASPGSSGRTVKPSRRTSGGSTASGSRTSRRAR